LLEELLSLGAVVVATSNRSIDALDASGAGAARDVFEAFAATLRDRAKEVEVRGETDHRRLEYDARRRESNDGGILRHSNDDSNYFYPSADASTRARFETKRRAWFPNESNESSSNASTSSATLPVAFGRRLIVPRVSPCGGAAHFTFDELCGRPLGTADYCALTKAFGVVFVEDVPRMSRATRDKARRFISLIDEAYNRNATLIFLAASHPDALFSGKSDGVVSSSDAVSTARWTAATAAAWTWSRSSSRRKRKTRGCVGTCARGGESRPSRGRRGRCASRNSGSPD
jgi:cell division protein ZapE